MWKCINFLSFILFVINSLHAQQSPFFIDLKNKDLGDNYYQTNSFCSNLNDKEIIYINNSLSPDYPYLLDYSSKLIKSTKKGEILKEIILDDGNRRCISSFGKKIGDQFIIMSFLHSADSFYLKVRKFNDDLEVNSVNDYPITKYFDNKINSVTDYVEMQTCIDDQGNTYIMLVTLLDMDPVMCFSFTPKGEIIKFKFLTGISITEPDGLVYDNLSGNLSYILDGRSKRIYSKDFEFIKSIELWKDDDWSSPYDTTSGWALSFLNVGDKIVRFGKTSFSYDNIEIDSFSYIGGRALSLADQNGSIKGKVNITDFNVSTESEGTPRLSGGLFYRDGFYYTLFEFSSTSFPFNTGNTTCIAKFDENFDIVQETRFVLDPRYRLFTVWAELTDDNSFIGSGFYYDVSPENPNAFENGGGFIYGLAADGSPPILSAGDKIIKAVFTVKGNPTFNNLTIETDQQKSIDYEVRVLDIQGKFIKSATNWAQGRIELDLSSEKPGTYFYNIVEKGNSLIGGKFIKI